MESIQEKQFHSLPVSELRKTLGLSDQEGLAQHEAVKRLKEFGPNALAKTAGDGPIKVFLRQFHNPLVYVLIVSAILATLMKKYTDAGVVLAVVILNSIIGFIQEFRAGKALAALASMVPEKALVLRSGIKVSIAAQELVPGDLVFLQSGDKVPADIRLSAIKNLKIEEASLTGESVPVEKNLDLIKATASIGDRSNMAYSGTLVTYGTAQGLVVSTGSSTELGKISTMLKQTTQIETPLTRSLAKVGNLLTLFISIISLLLFCVGVYRGYHVGDALLAAIALAVAAIPEGLPAIVTITLAVGVRRMAAKRAVIRRLPAVETLGSTQVICSDKTGTLTRNEMTVQAIFTATQKDYRITGTGYDTQGEIHQEGVRCLADLEVIDLLKSGVLCSDASFQKTSVAMESQGDPTELALVVAFEKIAGPHGELRESLPRADTLPFESENQFMATLHKAHKSHGYQVIVKGAPEVVLKKCPQVQSLEISDQVHRYASEGMRVLAFARKYQSSDKLSESSFQDLEFLGLQAMIDPARPEAIEAIKKCHSAGITVKMITGDHKQTAYAIAIKLGIAGDGQAITGEELSRTSDQDLPAMAMRSNVFARVAPEHKLRLVKAIQSQNFVVAMTGDGVNDAPALKQANIGIAMGITGTAVSKEAAELVLTDDNFATIREAVEEGRRVYDNLVKSLAFILPTNLGEALIVLVAVLFFPIIDGQPLMPILPVQIMWINLVATVALALPLAFEAKESDIMSRPPRDPAEPLLNRFVAFRTVVVAVLMAMGSIALFFYEYRTMLGLGFTVNHALKEAQTMAVTTMIFFQIFYLFNCRSLSGSVFSIGIFSNKSIYAGIFGLIALHILFVEAPFMNDLFHSGPLSVESWIKSIAVGALVLPLIAIEKYVRVRRARK